MRRGLPAVLFVGVLPLMLLQACKSSTTSNPTGPTGSTCRTYSTLQTGPISSASGQTGTFTETCTNYDKATNQITCTVNTTTSNPPSATTQVVVGNYASTADFVGEIKAVPPAYHPASNMTTTNGVPSATSTWTYDAQGRATQLLIVAPDRTETETFSGWDSAGRYTTAVDVSPSGTQTIAYSYNDAARTTTLTNAAAKITIVWTYNANGDVIKNVMTVNSVTTTIDSPVQTSFQVCY